MLHGEKLWIVGRKRQEVTRSWQKYIQKLIEKGYEAPCVEVKYKWRRVLVQLRGGTAALEVETGRWRGVSSVAAVLSYACRDDGVGRGVEKMWQKRFFDRNLTVPAPSPPSPLIPNV